MIFSTYYIIVGLPLVVGHCVEENEGLSQGLYPRDGPEW